MVYSPNKYRETEGIKVRRLGYALDVATLQQVAYNHGIYESVQNMTQAQKSQIRYIAIMEQSANAMNDMARTIESPANQMRIFEQRIDQFKRAVGNGLMPIVSAALPYLTAFVRILTETVQGIADSLGFEIPQFNYGDIVADSNKGIASSFDDATAAAKTFKGTLSSIDQLNIIGSHKESGTGDLTNPYDLDLDLPSYDFLDGLSESADDVYNKMKKVFSGIVGFVKEALPYVAAFGAAIVGIKLGGLIAQLPKLASTAFMAVKSFSPFQLALAAAASSAVLLYSGIKNLKTGTGNLANNIMKVKAGFGIATGAVAGFVATGHPIAAIAVAISAVVGALAGWDSAQREINRTISDSIVYMDNGGISIRGFTDGFKSYFSSITDHYDDILANTKAFESNETQLRNAAKEVSNLTDKYMNLDSEMTEADAQALADNIKKIGDSIRDNLGDAVQGIITGLQGTFGTFVTEMGGSVDDLIGKFNLLEELGGSSINYQQKKAEEIVKNITGGDLSLEERQEALQELNDTIKNMGANVDLGTDESYSFYNALKKATTAKIDFKNHDELLDNINSFKEMAATAKSSIEEARLALRKSTETEMERLKTAMYKDTGQTVAQAFDEMVGEGAFDKMFSETLAAIDESAKFDTGRIDNAMSLFVSSITDKLDQAVLDSAATEQIAFGDALSGTFTAYGETLADTMQNGSFWEKATAFLSPLGSLAGNSLVGNVDAVAEAEKKHLETIKEGYSDIYDALSETGVKVTDESKKIAADTIQGWVDGTIENQDDLFKALDSLGNKSIDTVRESLESNSPSRKTMEIGGDFDEGFRLGILRGEHDVFSTIREFGERVAVLFQSYMPDFGVYAEQASASFSKIYQPKTSYSYAAQTAPAVQSAGYDPRAVTEAAQLWGSVDRPIDVNVQLNSVVELDGDQVGQAVTNYQNGRVIASNGMAK